MLMLTLITGLVLALIYYSSYLPFQYWKKKNVPHPPVSYLFGNINEVIFLKKSLAQLCREIYNKYPDLPYVGFYRTRTPCILIRDPELVKEVLVKNFNSFYNNEITVDENTDPYFSRNPFTCKGQIWKQVRSQSAPLFTPKRIKEMHSIMKQVAKNLVEFLNTNNKGVDIKQTSLQYTTDVVTNCALGLEANSFINPDSIFIKMIKKVLSPSFTNYIKFFFIFNFPLLANIFKVQFIPSEAAEYFKNIVNKTIAYRRENNVQRGDFIDCMIELQEKLGVSNFTSQDITAHVLSFYTDGTETSSIVLSFLLYELSLHPDTQNTLWCKIKENLAKHNGNMTYETIQEIDYLDMVISETMRKNAPFPVLTKVCTQKTTLPLPYKTGKHVNIDVGTPILITVNSIHLDPKYYPNPSSFDPLRFSDEHINTRVNYTFLPFGEGPRICFGQRLAIAQIKVAMIHILQNFEVRMNKNTTVPYEIDPHHILLSAKDAIRLDFHKREK